jgi:hypothetical protein
MQQVAMVSNSVDDNKLALDITWAPGTKTGAETFNLVESEVRKFAKGCKHASVASTMDALSELCSKFIKQPTTLEVVNDWRMVGSIVLATEFTARNVNLDVMGNEAV